MATATKKRKRASAGQPVERMAGLPATAREVARGREAPAAGRAVDLAVSDAVVRAGCQELADAHRDELQPAELRFALRIASSQTALWSRDKLDALDLLRRFGLLPQGATAKISPPAIAAAADALQAPGEEDSGQAEPDEPAEAGAVDQATLDKIARLYSGDTYLDPKKPTVRGLIDANDVEALEAYGDAVWICIGTMGTGAGGIVEAVLQQVVRANDVGNVASVYATRDAQPIRALGQVWKLVDRTIKLRRAAPRPAKVGQTGRSESEQARDTIFEVRLDDLVRHPANREPKPAAIAERAKSLKELGQIEPIIVRDLRERPDAPPRWQVLSGETRWRAAAALGWQTLQARERQVDDAAALIVLAQANAQRQDLDPIERARLLSELMRPAAEGGAGLTSDAAGAIYGLDGGSVRQLARLLKLPPDWQARVAAGDLPQTFARLVLPYVGIPGLMQQLDEEWRTFAKLRAEDAAGGDIPRPWELSESPFTSRSGLAAALEQMVEAHTRPISPGRRHEYGARDRVWMGEQPLLFELTDDLRRQLGIVEIPVTRKVGKGKQAKEVTEQVEVATNVELYDQHQIPAIKAKLAAAEKKGAQRQADGDAKASAKKEKPAPTPAELKARAKEQAEQLATRVRAWRHRLLSDAIAARFGGGEEQYWATGKLVLWMLTVGCGGQEIRTALLGRTKYDWLSDPWATLGQVLPAGESPHDYQARANYHQILQDVAAALLRRPDSDSRRPHVPFEVVEGLALAMGVDIAAEWLKLQQPTDRYAGKTCRNEAKRESFYLLFQSAQLDALGKELGVHVADAKKREDKVRILVNIGRALPLPACLRLPEAKKGAKR